MNLVSAFETCSNGILRNVFCENEIKLFYLREYGITRNNNNKYHRFKPSFSEIVILQKKETILK